MKYLFFFLLIGAAATANAQKTFQETVEGDGTKVMKGLISKEVLTTEPSFSWWAQNEKGYTPPAAAVEAFKKNGNQIQVLCFGGTWCGDTKAILPKFYSLITAAGFLQSRLTVFGVDREKHTYGALAQALGVTNVPTFIVMKDGREVGRVVEYGKTGYWDKELGDIVAGVQ